MNSEAVLVSSSEAAVFANLEAAVFTNLEDAISEPCSSKAAAGGRGGRFFAGKGGSLPKGGFCAEMVGAPAW